MAQDPLGRRPPPPDDPSESDIAKQRRFIWAIHAARIGGAFQYPELLSAADERLSEKERKDLLERSRVLLGADSKCPNPDLVKWRVQWLDSRDGPYIRLVVAEWTVGVRTVRISALRNSSYVSALIGLPQYLGLHVRQRPPQEEFENYDDYENWQYISKSELRKSLADIFGLEYPSDKDLNLRGYVEVCADVPVFTGHIDPPPSNNRPVIAPNDRRKPAEWANLLITDSDPQYICLGVPIPQQETDRKPEP